MIVSVERPSVVDSTLLHCVESSVCHTFGVISGEAIVYCETPWDPQPCEGLCGIISFVGDVSWSFTLGLPRSSASWLVRAMVGYEIDFDCADMGDAVGELANILAGEVVARLEDAGIRANMSVPMVVRGHDVEWLLPTGFRRHQLVFTCPVGSFWVKVASCATPMVR